MTETDLSDLVLQVAQKGCKLVPIFFLVNSKLVAPFSTISLCCFLSLKRDQLELDGFSGVIAMVFLGMAALMHMGLVEQ